MSDYAFELIEDGIILLTYHVPVTDQVFRRATEDRVQFAAEHTQGDYILIVDYSQASMTISALNFRLNSWSATLDPRMIDALLISGSMIAVTGASLVQRVTHKKLEIMHTREEALARARVILAEHRAGRA